MGPSGNGLVGADERRAKNSAESMAYRTGAPVRFQKAVSGSKEKRRGEAPIGAPVRVMDRLLPSDEGTGPTARRPRCGDPHSACRRFAPSVRGTFPQRRPGARSPGTMEFGVVKYDERPTGRMVVACTQPVMPRESGASSTHQHQP